MTIRHMKLADLEMVLGWANAEGWNPGLDDAAAFLAADPQGFFLSEVNGTPAAAISVVNHDDAHAFLGLYICQPAFRGQGHGLRLWHHALAHAGTRSVGLDGVPAQQGNYAQQGFVKTGRTMRYLGSIDGEPRQPVQNTQRQTLIDADQQITGHARPRFAKAWFAPAPNRVSFAVSSGFATVRRCTEGYKIGPLNAPDRATALALLRARPNGWPSGPVFIDVPEGCSEMRALLDDLGFAPVFETARMVRGTAPGARPLPYCAIATMELG